MPRAPCCRPARLGHRRASFCELCVSVCERDRSFEQSCYRVTVTARGLRPLPSVIGGERERESPPHPPSGDATDMNSSTDREDCHGKPCVLEGVLKCQRRSESDRGRGWGGSHHKNTSNSVSGPSCQSNEGPPQPCNQQPKYRACNDTVESPKYSAEEGLSMRRPPARPAHGLGYPVM